MSARRFFAAVALFVLAIAAANAQALKPVRVGVGASGGTTLPALVITQHKLDEKHGLKIEWARLDQGALQRDFALRQFDVSFGQVASDLIRQRARGYKVTSLYSGIMANVYVVTKRDAPYQNFGDLRGQKVGLYSLTSSSTAALVKVVREKWRLELRKDFELVVSPPPVLAALLQRGDIEAMINVDPLVLRVLASGNYRQIMDIDDEWQTLTGSRLMVTTIAAWDDYAQHNPDVIPASHSRLPRGGRADRPGSADLRFYRVHQSLRPRGDPGDRQDVRAAIFETVHRSLGSGPDQRQPVGPRGRHRDG